MRLLLLAVVLPLVAAFPAVEGPTWLVGDWHVHTTHSHDVCDGRDPTSENCREAPFAIGLHPAARMMEARTRGLDYLRITDHGNVEGLAEARANARGVVLVPGYEQSLSGGHAGVTTLDLETRGVLPAPDPLSLADAAHAAPGGFFVVNHPMDRGGWAWQDPAWDWSRADAVEVWNIHWLYRDEVLQGLVDTSENDEALDMWTALLDAGLRLAIVGGSDSHAIATSAVQGVGQPATWIYAERDAASIVEAARAGRTQVTSDFTGPFVTLDPMPGDVVPAATTMIRASAPLAPADELRIVSCRGVEAAARGPGEIAARGPFPAGCWARAEVVAVEEAAGVERLVYRAITGAIYLV